MSVTEQALKAHREHEKQLRAERQERENLRQVEEREKDEAALRDVVNRSPLAEWFPGTTWVLVDRKFPQTAAVVHPSGEPDVLLRVTLTSYADVEPPQFIVGLVERNDHPVTVPWREEARIRCPADLGRALNDRQRQVAEVSVQ